MTLSSRLKVLDTKVPKIEWIDQPTESFVAQAWLNVTSPGGFFIVNADGPPADVSLLSEGGRGLLNLLERLWSGSKLDDWIPPDEHEEFYDYLAWFLEENGVDVERVTDVVSAVRDNRLSF